jgi:hypothetical protein
MADKGALERIGMMLFAATLFVIGAAGFAVHHQLATDTVLSARMAQLPATAPKSDTAVLK